MEADSFEGSLLTAPVEVIDRSTTYQSKVLSVSHISEPGSHLCVTQFGTAPRGGGVVLYLNVLTTDLIKLAFPKVIEPSSLQDSASFVAVGDKYFPLKFAEKGEIEGSEKGAWDFFCGVIRKIAPKELNMYRDMPYFSAKATLLKDLRDCTSEKYAKSVPTATKDLHFKFSVVCSENKCKVKHPGSKCSETCEKCPMRGCVGGKFSFYFDKEGRPYILTPYSTIALFLTTNVCRHQSDLVRVQNYCRLESEKKGYVEKLKHISSKLIR
jgi:hypothetical protein